MLSLFSFFFPITRICGETKSRRRRRRRRWFGGSGAWRGEIKEETSSRLPLS